MENTIKQNIAKTKSLLCGLQDVKKSFETVSSNIKREVEHIQNMQAKEIPVIPEIDYKSILNGSVSISQIAEIKRRGSLIIRGVFDEQLAREWNEEIVEYILRNDYYTKSIEKEGMDQYFSQLNGVSKSKELIVFCGGWKCGKSPKVAGMLKKIGFKNVKLYQAGEPQWKKKSYVEVDTAVMASAQKKNNAVLIDARPYKKYLQETIPGAIAIPDTNMGKLLGKFPADKNIKIITFCGGYGCGKSHKVAKKLLSMGYTNVVVYAGGLPKWKKDGMGTTKSASKKTAAKKATAMKTTNGIKKGEDEGTVDGEWFKKLVKTNMVPTFMQIVDVTPPEDFKSGHLPNAVNIYAEELSVKALMKALPKDKVTVFTCASGARALEAWAKLKEDGHISEQEYDQAREKLLNNS